MANKRAAVEDTILALCRKYTEGLPQDKVDEVLPVELSKDALNNLLGSMRIKVFIGKDGVLTYQETSPEQATKLKGLSTEDILVYQEIERAGNLGMWTKDLKMKTNLQQPVVTKILKTLEHRNLIKSVKSVQNPTRKVYLLYDLEPARELTGGAWYTDQDFDAQFIEGLQRVCLKYVENEMSATLEDVADFIRTKELSRVELRDEDILSILRTLEYDGLVECYLGEDGEAFRLARQTIPQSSPFTSIPCGVCPVIDDCSDDGVISPSSCVYYQKWLEF